MTARGTTAFLSLSHMEPTRDSWLLLLTSGEKDRESERNAEKRENVYSSEVRKGSTRTSRHCEIKLLQLQECDSIRFTFPLKTGFIYTVGRRRFGSVR